MNIPDSGSEFSAIPDPVSGGQKAPDPGSESATVKNVTNRVSSFSEVDKTVLGTSEEKQPPGSGEKN